MRYRQIGIDEAVAVGDPALIDRAHAVGDPNINEAIGLAVKESRSMRTTI